MEAGREGSPLLPAVQPQPLAFWLLGGCLWKLPLKSDRSSSAGQGAFPCSMPLRSPAAACLFQPAELFPMISFSLARSLPLQPDPLRGLGLGRRRWCLPHPAPLGPGDLRWVTGGLCSLPRFSWSGGTGGGEGQPGAGPVSIQLCASSVSDPMPDARDTVGARADEQGRVHRGWGRRASLAGDGLCRGPEAAGSPMPCGCSGRPVWQEWVKRGEQWQWGRWAIR